MGFSVTHTSHDDRSIKGPDIYLLCISTCALEPCIPGNNMRYLAFVMYVISLLEGIRGYQMFQERIPNGEIVPNPCKANYIWRGVGHKNALGGGERNPFGLAFDAVGEQWTKAICMQDSDGDGKTNGDELGDPNCIWTKGQSPSRSSGLSHPGVCEPMNSTLCAGMNNWIDCHVDEFQCDAINDNETRNLTVRFPKTEVPPKETTYKCMIFDLPQDGDFHLVATKVLLDNVNVMHHILIFGCTNAINSSFPLNRPYDCAMSPGAECSDIIGTWTVGVSGECHHESSGIRIGLNSYRRAAFQFHWNNPALVNGTTDSSGLTLYYTPKLRPYDAGILLVGQAYLYIPPGETAVTAIGKQQRIELLRNGSKVQDVTFDEQYSYDSPVLHRHDNPIEVRPGDELKTTCVFKSTSRYKTTIFGEDTSKEMCIGFIAYYPKGNFPNPRCSQWNSVSMCDWRKDVIQGCRHKDIFNISIPESSAIFKYVMENCAPLGTCQKECLVAVRKVKNHPCFQGDMDKLQRTKAVNMENPALKSTLLAFFAALDSCNVNLALEAAGLNGMATNFTTSDGSRVCTEAGFVWKIQTLIMLSSFVIWKYL